LIHWFLYALPFWHFFCEPSVSSAFSSKVFYFPRPFPLHSAMSKPFGSRVLSPLPRFSDFRLGSKQSLPLVTWLLHSPRPLCPRPLFSLFFCLYAVKPGRSPPPARNGTLMCVSFQEVSFLFFLSFLRSSYFPHLFHFPSSLSNRPLGVPTSHRSYCVLQHFPLS